MTEQMVQTFEQQEQGWMIYPAEGWRKLVFKLPVYLWRLGLARLLPPNFLLLTTIGRKSGLLRRSMVEYGYADGGFYLASGWGEKAHWYRNVLAHPYVTVQTVHEGAVRGKATLVTDEQELAMLFNHVQGHSPVWKDYLASWGIEDNVQDFVAKKDRLYVLRIDPTDASATPPPQPVDLWWVWPLAGATAAIATWFSRRRSGER